VRRAIAAVALAALLGACTDEARRGSSVRPDAAAEVPAVASVSATVTPGVVAPSVSPTGVASPSFPAATNAGGAASPTVAAAAGPAPVAPASPQSSRGPRDDTPPVLSVSIVDLSGTFDAASARLGALLCTSKFPTDPNDRWCFGAFGGGAMKTGVSLDYKVAAGSTVRAATAGTVAEIEADANPLYPGEFEVRTRSSPTSTYLVIYDHIRDPRVSLGSTVVAGQTLGIAGIHTSGPAIWGRVELQINRYPDVPDRRGGESLCPQMFGTEAFRREQEAALAAHNAANPAFAAAAVCVATRIASR